jgi:hypothetical protein
MRLEADRQGRAVGPHGDPESVVAAGDLLDGERDGAARAGE